jgi:DNA topoisomerase-1
VVHLDEADARALAAALEDTRRSPSGPSSRSRTAPPYAPFRTSTLQQEASRKLGFSARRPRCGRAAAVRERLHHLHAYRLGRRCRRPRSPRPAPGRASCTAPSTCRRSRAYTGKVKNAQEAHEAIRPAGDNFRTPAVANRPDRRRVPALRADLEAHRRLADEGRGRQLGHGEDRGHLVRRPRTSSSRLRQDDHLPRLPARPTSRAPTTRTPSRTTAERRLPQVAEGDALTAEELTVATGTPPSRPARYTEASLVKELEEREIGRPSTYASIIGTILDRGYVFKKGTALVPSFLAFAVVNLLEKHFGRLVDYDFTAKMEDDLDEHRRGEAQAVPWLRRFYFGAATATTSAGSRSSSPTSAIDAREVSSFPVGNDRASCCASAATARTSSAARRTPRTTSAPNVPEDLAPDELTRREGGGAARQAER